MRLWWIKWLFRVRLAELGPRRFPMLCNDPWRERVGIILLKLLKPNGILSFNIPFKKHFYTNTRTDRMTWNYMFYLCLICHFQLCLWQRYFCLTLFLNLRKKSYFYCLNILKYQLIKWTYLQIGWGFFIARFHLEFLVLFVFGMERETGEYKTMAYGMGKSRNWEIILWFISWNENITPHCTLKMRHLRHCTKWICLIQHINWEIENAILDIAFPSTVNIILLSYLLLLYIFLPKCCSIQKLFKMFSVRIFLGEQMKHSKCTSKALRRPLKL